MGPSKRKSHVKGETLPSFSKRNLHENIFFMACMESCACGVGQGRGLTKTATNIFFLISSYSTRLEISL